MLAKFVLALRHEHKLVAAMSSGGEPSYIRGPKALLDFITFIFAIAMLRSWEMDNGGDEDDFQEWEDASRVGFGSVMAKLWDVFLTMLYETILLVMLTTVPHYFLSEAMHQREAARTLHVMWEERLQYVGVRRVDVRSTRCVVDVRRALHSAAAAQRVAVRCIALAAKPGWVVTEGFDPQAVVDSLSEYIGLLSARYKALDGDEAEQVE